jgi:hypothetical protein
VLEELTPVCLSEALSLSSCTHPAGIFHMAFSQYARKKSRMVFMHKNMKTIKDYAAHSLLAQDLSTT